MGSGKELVNSFYIGFWLYLSAAIVLFALVVCLFLFRKKIVKPSANMVKRIPFYIGLVVILAINSVIAVFFARYAQDLSAVRNKQFETITGTVIGYNNVQYDESQGHSKYFNPIVKADDKDLTIVLNVGPTELNQNYTFIYLKHTRLAEIVSKS